MKRHSSPVAQPALLSVTFVSSGGRKTGKPLRTASDRSSLTPKQVISHRKYSEACPFPTSGTGITRKSSVDATFLSSPPPIIHFEKPDAEFAQEKSFEDVKCSSKEFRAERVSEMSTHSELPSDKREAETPKLTSSKLVSMSKLANRLSEKELNRIFWDLDSETPKAGKKPEKLKAYKEFLYYLFESICLIKRISPWIKTFPVERKLYLPRPAGLESTFFEN